MSRTVRTPDAFARVAAAGVVPAVGIAAHGVAGGGTPTTGGVLLCLAIGAVAALIPTTGRRRRFASSATSTVVVLTAAQVACHWSLSAEAGHGVHATPMLPMALTHLLAIPVTAALIVAGAHLLARAGTVIRTLLPPPVPQLPGPRRTFWTSPPLAAALVVGGTGVRGPPVGF